MTFRKAVRQDSTNRIKAVFRTRHSIRTNTLAEVVTKAGVVDMGISTTVAVAGIRDSPRERVHGA